MPTVSKPKTNTTSKAVETLPKGAKKTEVVKPVKNTPKTSKETAKVKPTKATSKTETKTPGKKRAPTTGAYKPVTNSMRDFVFQALKRGGSAKKIKSRAAAIAERAGVEKFANTEAYKGFDIAFFVSMLEARGIKVLKEGNKYKVA